jgi:hypothetical protein
MVTNAATLPLRAPERGPTRGLPVGVDPVRLQDDGDSLGPVSTRQSNSYRIPPGRSGRRSRLAVIFRSMAGMVGGQAFGHAVGGSMRPRPTSPVLGSLVSQFRSFVPPRATVRKVPVFASRSGLRRRVTAQLAALRIDRAGSTPDGEADSPWALPVLAFTLCAITTVSLVLNGNAAIMLFGLALAAAVLGVPTCLVVGRLRGSTTSSSSSRYHPPAA